MTDQASSKYWLDQVVEKVIADHPQGEVVVSSGHSPSGRYHIGILREFVTCDGLVRELNSRGRAAKHLDFVDDFDRLRKIPAGVPDSFAEHLGKPLYLAPDPVGKCHDSYADHYFAELSEAVARAEVQPEIIRSHKQYQAGRFTDAITQSLKKLDTVKAVIKEVGGRELEPDWVPVQLLSDNQRLDDWQFAGWDEKKQVVFWQDSKGHEGELDYTQGRVKLDWRLDWPARWQLWQVAVEPFGRDHASAGGSYDTGKVLVEKVFGAQAPTPVPYDFINIVGQTKKMSKSAGGVITPGEALDIMPAEIMRYFVLRSRPNKLLFFDPGLGLYNLIDEFAKVERAVQEQESPDFQQAYEVATAGRQTQTIARVPFSHLVAVYQAAQGKFDQILDILGRTGYQTVVEKQREVLQREVDYVANWLKVYAPDSVKFAVQKTVPEAELSAQQQQFLADLADGIAKEQQALNGQGYHDLVYAEMEKVDLKPAQAFQAIYRVILGQDSGPKAGWFLASLEPDWLVKRFRLEA